MERRLGRRRVLLLDEQRIAAPADFDAAEQIGLRARHPVEAGRLEGRVLAEDVGIGMEADLGAAPVVDLAERLQRGLRNAARKTLAVELAAARHLDLEVIGQRVDHRNADAVQAARGLIDLGVEFAARMQRRHDDFERRLVLEFRVRVDRDAAAIVDDGEEAVGGQLHVDEGGMAGHRLVHRIVDHFGEQVVQRLLVGAADIHAGAAAHRLQAFQHLDVAGVCSLRCHPSRRRLRLTAWTSGSAGRDDARAGVAGVLSSLAKRSLLSSMRRACSPVMRIACDTATFCPAKGQGVPVPFMSKQASALVRAHA